MDDAGRRIAMIGAGAIGGSVAADLSDLGRHEICLCVRTRFDALEVRHPGGVSKVDARIVDSPGRIGPVDWILLATKAHQSAAARPWFDALCRANTRIAVLQNGVDHVERIAALAPLAASVLPVVVQLPAEKTAPGRVEQALGGMLLVPDDAAGREFAALFDGGRIAVRPTADFRTQAWWKLLSNAALGGICALTLRENGVAAEPEVRALALELMREVAAVGRAEGARLPDDAPEKALALMLKAVPGHWTSIAVDRREGRPMEWRVRNQIVVDLGRRHGVATPLNDAVTVLLRAADAGGSRASANDL